jgi:hypothetical protein
LDPGASRGRKSATAAAMTSTSAAGSAAATASRICSAVSTRTSSTPTGAGSAEGPEISVTSAPRRQAAAASAYPIRPEERFPM